MLEEFIADNLVLLIILMAWTLVWTGWALWKAARRADKLWFIVLLVVNTVGFLEILYIFFFSKREDPKKEEITGEAETEE